MHRNAPEIHRRGQERVRIEHPPDQIQHRRYIRAPVYILLEQYTHTDVVEQGLPGKIIGDIPVDDIFLFQTVPQAGQCFIVLLDDYSTVERTDRCTGDQIPVVFSQLAQRPYCAVLIGTARTAA